MSDLADQRCEPCRGGMPPMTPEQIAPLLEQLGGGWQVVDHHHLTKTFTFPDFKAALAFTNEVGALAEEIWHHPDLTLAWGKVGVALWTHKIDGLHVADFVLAAKIDRLRADREAGAAGEGGG